MNEEINRFFVTINEIIDSIKSLESPKFQENYKKTLLFSLIEMLSKATYGNQIGNKEKFTRLILEFGQWRDANRVSSQQLLLLLSNDTQPIFSDLKDYSQEIVDSWPKSTPIYINNDPEKDEVSSVWPSGHKINNRFGLDHFTHVNLLWNLRNSLVHEMRSLGLSTKLFDEEQPHYISMGKIYKDNHTGKVESIDHKVWELYYPVNFYFMLVENINRNLKGYFNTNSINPFATFEMGSSWFR